MTLYLVLGCFHQAGGGEAARFFFLRIQEGFQAPVLYISRRFPPGVKTSNSRAENARGPPQELAPNRAEHPLTLPVSLFILIPSLLVGGQPRCIPPVLPMIRVFQVLPCRMPATAWDQQTATRDHPTPTATLARCVS